MIIDCKNANAQQELGNSVKQKQHKPNHNKYKRQQDCISGWPLYEYLKRSYIDSNPNCTNVEYDQAMLSFARLAGV